MDVQHLHILYDCYSKMELLHAVLEIDVLILSAHSWEY